MKPSDEELEDLAITLVGFTAGMLGRHPKTNTQPDWKYLEKRFLETLKSVRELSIADNDLQWVENIKEIQGVMNLKDRKQN